MSTIHFKNVYVNGRAIVGGPLEKEGPLGYTFDKTYDDLYANEKTFEKAERAFVYDACDMAIRKANLHTEDIDLMVGGDLINQLTSSNYFARDVDSPFLGMFGACSNSTLVVGQAAIWVEHQLANNVLAFTSSHNATAERQFRYPNEYGIQKKETTTFTVTGAGAAIISNKPSNIRVAAFTPGKVFDWDHKDANDMGLAMAPAAYDTLIKHFKDTNRSFDDYDLIVTGDLSKIGFSFLADLLVQEGHVLDNKLNDCGMMIYDIQNQPVFCGGSGCASSMCVTMGDILNKIESGEYRRVLVLSTGALLSPVAIQQKESIPCIAHGVVYERSDLL